MRDVLLTTIAGVIAYGLVIKPITDRVEPAMLDLFRALVELFL